MRFSLVEKGTQQIAGRAATTYTYRNEAGGRVKFCADPQTPFKWYFLSTTEAVQGTLRNKVLDAFADAGFRQHEFAGGFDEAIQHLDVA